MKRNEIQKRKEKKPKNPYLKSQFSGGKIEERIEVESIDRRGIMIAVTPH